MQREKRLFKHSEGFHSLDKDPHDFEGENQANNCKEGLEPKLRKILDENKEEIFKRENIHKP